MRSIWLVFAFALAGCTKSGDDSGQTTDPPVDADADGYAVDVDCDDTNADVHPDATETCNGVDDNCDQQVDEGLSTATYYPDTDGDGYGTDAGAEACAQPAQTSTIPGDCDDSSAAINPEAAETCNALDDNCNGSVDEGVKTTFYADVDGDGYGDAGAPILACELPAKSSAVDTDCDDADKTIHPGAPERCDGEVDDDCDATTGEDGLVSWDDGTTFIDVTSTFAAGDADAGVYWSTPGPGTLWMCAGTWYVHLTATENLDLRGSGAGTTVLDGDQEDSVLGIQTNGLTVSMSNLTVQYGAFGGPFGGDPYVGGGIWCLASTTLSLDAVSVINNEATYGGGLFTQNCTVDIVDSTFDNNKAQLGAGLIDLDAKVTVTSSTFSHNDATEFGGGLGLASQTGDGVPTLDLVDTQVTDNTAEAAGAGMWVDAGEATCTGATKETAGFSGNTLFGVYVADGVFSADVCDFGGGNDPDSVLTGDGSTWDYGDDATFSCDVTGCLPS